MMHPEPASLSSPLEHRQQLDGDGPAMACASVPEHIMHARHTATHFQLRGSADQENAPPNESNRSAPQLSGSKSRTHDVPSRKRTTYDTVRALSSS